MDVVDNSAHRRFEVAVDGALAIANYILKGQVIAFTHTEVPDELRGKGIGGVLVRAALDAARARGLRVVPLCPYVSSFIKRHPAYQDLVDTP